MARVVGAMTRASWQQARSYRLSLVMQTGGMLFMVVPMYFITNALQSTMEKTIAAESGQYFSFLLVGSATLMLATVALTTLQSAISGGISSGYFESLLMTRASVPWILAGLSSYGMLLTAIRVMVMIIAGWLLGANVAWSRAIPAVFVLILVVVVHWGIGLIGSGLVIAFRTAGPLTQIVTTVSIFFGGVYYPVAAIPSWLRNIADATPLAYGIRAVRRVLLQGAGLGAVSSDIAILAAMGVVSLIVGAWAFSWALSYARKAGTLSSY